MTRKLKVVVLGAGGFIGSRLAFSLAKHAQLSVAPSTERVGVADLKSLPTPQIFDFHTLVLFDLRIGEEVVAKTQEVAAASGGGLHVVVMEGDICNHQHLENVLRERVDDGFAFDHLVVYNTAAIMSGPSEVSFDLGMQINLFANTTILEIVRKVGSRLGCPQTLIFTSTDYVNCFNDRNRAEPCGEEAFQLSSVSYGVQKACVELLMSDYSRKGFLDGRVLRLSTVVVKPGVFDVLTFPFHGIVSQTLAGETFHCGLPKTTALPCAYIGHVVDGLVCLATKIDAKDIGHNRVVQVPAESISLAEIWESVQRVAQQNNLPLGNLVWGNMEQSTTTVKEINVCPNISWKKAKKLGMNYEFNFDEVVKDYIAHCHKPQQ